MLHIVKFTAQVRECRGKKQDLGSPSKESYSLNILENNFLENICVAKGTGANAT